MGWFTQDQIETPIPWEQIHTMFLDGVIGTKEYRNWLEQVDPFFQRIRDTEVDNQIDQLARERARLIIPTEEDEEPRVDGQTG